MRKIIYELMVIFGVLLGGWMSYSAHSPLSMMIPDVVSAEELKYEIPGTDAYLDYTYTNNGIKIVDVNPGSELVLSIPQQINGYDVIELGDGCLDYCNELESVTLPDSIEIIGRSAFYLSSLKSVSLPERLVEIKSSAFFGCSSLQSITIPENVRIIGAQAFSSCKNLETAFIPQYVESIDGNIFYGSEKLTSITVDDRNPSYMSIDGVLYDRSMTILLSYPPAKSVDNYTIPYGVERIEQSAFRGCNYLRRISVPQSVSSIGNSAFYICNKLEEIESDTGLAGIEANAFYGCSSLKRIKLSNQLEKIQHGTFEKCTSLKSVRIPQNVTEILEYAFRDCSDLNEISLPSNLKKLGGLAFYGCTSLNKIKVPDKIGMIDSLTFAYCSNLKEVILPNGLKSIGNFAFSGCAKLNSISIPKGVSSIGHSAFGDCKELVKIQLPEDITELGYNTFFGCEKLQKIVLPNKLKDIGRSAFQGCKSISEIVLPESIKTIGPYAFASCDNLTYIGIPRFIESIDSSAFGFGLILRDIYYGGNSDEWNSIGYSISGCNIHYGTSSPFDMNSERIMNVGILDSHTNNSVTIDGKTYVKIRAINGVLLLYDYNVQVGDYVTYWLSKTSSGEEVITGINGMQKGEDIVTVNSWDAATGEMRASGKNYKLDESCDLGQMIINQGDRLKINWYKGYGQKDVPMIISLIKIETNVGKLYSVNTNEGTVTFGERLLPENQLESQETLTCDTDVLSSIADKAGQRFIYTKHNGVVSFAIPVERIKPHVTVDAVPQISDIEYDNNSKTIDSTSTKIKIEVKCDVNMPKEFEGDKNIVNSLYHSRVYSATFKSDSSKFIKVDGRINKDITELSGLKLKAGTSKVALINVEFNTNYKMAEGIETEIMSFDVRIDTDDGEKSISKQITIRKYRSIDEAGRKAFVDLSNTICDFDIDELKLDKVLQPSQLRDVKQYIGTWLAVIYDDSISIDVKNSLFDSFSIVDGRMVSDASIRVKMGSYKRKREDLVLHFHVDINDFDYGHVWTRILGVDVGSLGELFDLTCRAEGGGDLGRSYGTQKVVKVSANVGELNAAIQKYSDKIKKQVASDLIGDFAGGLNSLADDLIDNAQTLNLTKFSINLTKSLVKNLVINDVGNDTIQKISKELIVDNYPNEIVTGAIRSVFCPVDVYVYYGDHLVGSVINDQIIETDDNMSLGSIVEVDGDTKYIYDPGYGLDVVLVGNDEGSMKYVVEEYKDGVNADGSLLSTVTYEQLPLSQGRTYYENIGQNEDEYTLISEGMQFEPDSIVNTVIDNGFNVSIQNYTDVKSPAVIQGLDEAEGYSGETSFSVSSDRACVVAYSIDEGMSYTKLVPGKEEGNTREFMLTVDRDMKLFVGLQGDAMLDGSTSLKDATYIKQYLVGMREMTPQQKMVADVIGNDGVSLKDATFIKQYLVGMRSFAW